MSSPMVAIGGVQILSGVVLITADIIWMAMHHGVPIMLYLPLSFGLFYTITGALGVAGGKATPDKARGLAVASLVMSILSILSSFALIFVSGLMVAYSARYAIRQLPVQVPQVVFFSVMFSSSIAMCVFAVRAMSLKTRTTHVTQVTHVIGQSGVMFASGPQPYPAGQQGHYRVPFPQIV